MKRNPKNHTGLKLSPDEIEYIGNWLLNELWDGEQPEGLGIIRRSEEKIRADGFNPRRFIDSGYVYREYKEPELAHLLSISPHFVKIFF